MGFSGNKEHNCISYIPLKTTKSSLVSTNETPLSPQSLLQGLKKKETKSTIDVIDMGDFKESFERGIKGGESNEKSFNYCNDKKNDFKRCSDFNNNKVAFSNNDKTPKEQTKLDAISKNKKKIDENHNLNKAKSENKKDLKNEKGNKEPSSNNKTTCLLYLTNTQRNNYKEKNKNKSIRLVDANLNL